MTDDLDDRLSRRFESDRDDSKEQPSEQSRDNSSSAEAGTDRNAQTSQNAQNVKKEWNVRSFYLDDELDRKLTTTFKRLDLALSEADVDLDLKKTRHFYPLIVTLGLERLEEMERTDITERLEGTDRE